MPAITNYLDFDVLVEREGDGYRTRVIDSPGGQATSEFQLPFSALELENFLLRVGMSLSEIRRHVRRIDSSDMAEIKTFGGRLFRALFDEQLRPSLVRSLDEARRRQAGLRLRLRLSDAPELADFPWEFLYDTGANRFLNLSVETPLVRYLELSEPGRPLTVQPPLRVLVMISGPSDVRSLDVEREWARITSAVADLESRGLVAVERLESATLAALQRTLRRGEYHIFHYVGHGGYDEQSQDGVLLLEGMDGRSRPVSGQDLGTLLHDHRSLRLVILNSCEGARSSPTDPFAGAAQSLVQQGIPAVIAMQFEITDEAAITLSHEFYSALADGYAVDTALGEARKAIFAGGNEVEWATPVLYMRSPNGRIFRIAQQPSSRGTSAKGAERGQPPPPASVTPARDLVDNVASIAEEPVESLPKPAPRSAPAKEAAPDVVEEVTSIASEPVESVTKPAPRSTPTMSATRLSLIGAAILLVGLGFSYGQDAELYWFVLEPLLAVAGSAVIAVLTLKGRQPSWGSGALIGLGFYLVATHLQFVRHPDYGFQVGEAGMVIGAGLVAGAGLFIWKMSPASEPRGVGWMPAAGALVVAVAAFLPVTSEDGPTFFADMGDWLIGNKQAVLVPLVLVAGWIFLLALYPAKRVSEQHGQVLALGTELIVFFLAMAGYATFSKGWGTNYGLWIGLAGAGLVAAGVLRPLRAAKV